MASLLGKIGLTILGYLEMVCHFPGKGDFFSRALDAALSGTTGWTAQETAFVLKPGENPDNIKLNVVIEIHFRYSFYSAVRANATLATGTVTCSAWHKSVLNIPIAA